MEVLLRAIRTAQIPGHGGHRRGSRAGLPAARGLLPPQRPLVSVSQVRFQESESGNLSTNPVNVLQSDTQFVDAVHLCFLRTVIGQERTLAPKLSRVTWAPARVCRTTADYYVLSLISARTLY